jgi:hypothetical protein
MCTMRSRETSFCLAFAYKRYTSYPPSTSNVQPPPTRIVIHQVHLVRNTTNIISPISIVIYTMPRPFNPFAQPINSTHRRKGKEAEWMVESSEPGTLAMHSLKLVREPTSGQQFGYTIDYGYFTIDLMVLLNNFVNPDYDRQYQELMLTAEDTHVEQRIYPLTALQGLPQKRGVTSGMLRAWMALMDAICADGQYVLYQV